MRARTHPGEVLKEEFMLPYNLSANALALALRVPVTRLADIREGRRSVSPDTALRLARLFKTMPLFWLNLQTAYDLSIVENKDGEQISRDVAPLSMQA